MTQSMVVHINDPSVVRDETLRSLTTTVSLKNHDDLGITFDGCSRPPISESAFEAPHNESCALPLNCIGLDRMTSIAAAMRVPKMGAAAAPSSASSLAALFSPSATPHHLTTKTTETGSDLQSDMASPVSMNHNITVTLPKLRIPTDAEVMTGQHPQWPHSSSAPHAAIPHHPASATYQQQSTTRMMVMPVSAAKSTSAAGGATGPLTRSPSSPAAFFEDPENKFGLTHLLEAAEQCLPVPVRSSPSSHTHASSNMYQQEQQSSMRKRSFSEREPQQQQQQQQQYQQYHQELPPMAHKMHSIGYLVEDERSFTKRARPELPVNFHPSFGGLSLHPQTHHHVHQPAMAAPVFRAPISSHEMSSPTSTGSGSPSSGVTMPSMVWETVITSGKFPSDVCLSENSSTSASKSSEGPSSDNPVKQGRWTCDEKEFAEALIQSVRNGDAVLPPNVSLRKFIADSLQCKAMRVSKKFRSLRSCHSPQSGSSPRESDTPREKSFNPLSLRSIMNNEAASEHEHSVCMVSSSSAHPQQVVHHHHQQQQQQQQQESPKKTQRVLKRSDYSQHGMVRSGRWSLEEENYAKAMIEAFKAGYLPLHGNVSLRKFLSEVLVCHPMRISKKFVGYVRKYHWYRIAAGKCDPEAKQKALEQLCHLERAFWASMQQSNDWSLASHEE